MRTSESMLGRLKMAARTASWPGIVMALAIWEIAPRLELVPSSFVPPASHVLAEFVAMLVTAPFWTDVQSTMLAWAVGLLLAMVAAVAAGILIGSNVYAYRATRFLIEFLRPIPAVALIPLAVLIFGITTDMKVFLVVFATFWPILFQAVYGVRETDSVARDTARSFGFTRAEVFWHVTLPSAAPSIATGVRLASALAIVIAVTAELIAGGPGLGTAILAAQSAGSSVRMYALIFAAGLLSYITGSIIVALERRLLRWHPSHRKAIA